MPTGGFDITGSALELTAVPGTPFTLGTPIELQPVRIIDEGLAAAYFVTVDDFGTGGRWELQLEVTTPTGQVLSSEPGSFFFTPLLEGEET